MDTYEIDAAILRSPDIAQAVETERRRVLALLDMTGCDRAVRYLIEGGHTVEAAAKLIAERNTNDPKR